MKKSFYWSVMLIAGLVVAGIYSTNVLAQVADPLETPEVPDQVMEQTPVVDPDIDEDTIADDVDNCIDIANEDQADADANSIGDACDEPMDDEGEVQGLRVSLPTGAIEITKYACPADTVVTRTANGVGDTVPGGCVLDSGKTFGYVHGTQTDANPPYPELSTPLTAGGSTNGSGVLTISGLPADGRYLIVETNGSNEQLPAGDILGLYCEGDGDTSNTNDNQELTFVPNNGTVHCVAYNKAPAETDACTLTVVSDTSNDVVGGGSAIATWAHDLWASITDAIWIWSEEEVSDPSSTTTETFTKDFYVDGPVNDATLTLAADNTYDVSINGTQVAVNGGEFNYGTVAGPFNVAAQVTSGWNTIKFEVSNIGVAGEDDAHENPAGALYKLVINDGEKEECAQPDPQDDTILTVVKTVENKFGGILNPWDFNLNVSWYSGNSNDESSPWRGFPGAATGTDFYVNPGEFVVGEDTYPGYSVVIDTSAGPRCTYAILHEGEHLVCPVINKQLPSTERGDEVSCEELEGQSGWYAQYFNYSWERPEMYNYYSGIPGETYEPVGDTFGVELWGEPMDPTSSSSEWYDLDDEFRFSRVDSDLEFGEHFFPFFNGAVEETVYLPNVDYHFGVHWTATVDVPVDGADYNFYGKVDDDLWIYVNGVRHNFGNPGPNGVHNPVGVTGSLSLTDGDVIDVYYAERSPSDAVMYLEFVNNSDEIKDNDVAFAPYNTACDQLACDPKVNLIENGSFEDPVVTDNGGDWQLFLSGITGWFADFVSDGNDAPLEIQAGYSGWIAGAGDQYTELDSTAPTVVSQDIETIPGAEYLLTYKRAARPGTAADNNAVSVLVNGDEINNYVFAATTGNPDWDASGDIYFTATTSETRLSFKDIGSSADSLGTFIDDVALYCIPEGDDDDTSEIVIVRPSDLNFDFAVPEVKDWYFWDDVSDTPSTAELAGEYEFVTGPSTPALPVGSVQMSVGGSERWNIATFQFEGVDLSDIGAMSFDTYEPVTNPGSNEAIYLNFDVDFDNTTTDGYQGRLVFVPADQGTVNEGVWENHDAFGASLWRWSAYAGGTFNANAGATAGTWPDGSATEVRTWNDIVSTNPNAEVFNEGAFGGQLLFRAGEPYPAGFTGAVDNFSIKIGSHTTTFDFEPEEAAPTLTIVKNTVGGGDDTFGFVLSDATGTTTEITTSEGSGSITFPINEGTTTINELLEDNWDLTDVYCIYDGNEAGQATEDGGHEIFADDGDEITCYFENTFDGDEGDNLGSVSGYKWNDLDADGIRDEGEPTIAGVTIQLFGEGNLLDSAVTGEDGSYIITHSASPYTLCELSQTGWTQTWPNDSDDCHDITIVVDATLNDQNFGNHENPAITGDDDDDDNGGPTSSRRRGGGGGSSSNGEVLGATTDTQFCPFLRDYQHINLQNDPSEVNKAKAFFNSYLGKALTLDGTFDKAMFDSVWEFQSMFQDDVLNTWTEKFPGVLDNRPTGYLYQTTKWKINSIVCPGYETFPDQLIIAPGTTVR